ncbi:MAG: M23 family metallopeptidase [Pseudomonadota bacterium]
MRMSAVAVLMILTTVLLSGCGKDENQLASLDDRQGSFYGRNGVMSLASAARPISNATYTDAAVMSVSSNDLPPAGVTTRSASWQWPVQGTVTQRYGKQSDGTANEGITIAAAEGTPIRAAQGGEVAFVGQDTKNYGNIVILRHADGEMTSYAHAREIIVKKGAQVPSGSVLGYVGKSGNAKSPELHFAVREGNHGIDPLSKLPQHVASN